MNKKILLTLSVSFALLLTGCGKTASSGVSSSEETPTSSSSEEPVPEGKVRVNIPSMTNGAKSGGYNVDLDYGDELFLGDAKNYNKYLSLLSFGAAMCTISGGVATKFYQDIEFDNIEVSPSYQTTPTEDSIGYILAHKTIGDYDLVALSVRGLDYGVEWANNLTIGETGDHEGFTARVQEIHTALQGYVGQNASKTLKLWFNGYSRGAGVSNLLANNILTNHSLSVTQENMYVYTFEAPRGVETANLGNWANVHNIMNSADLVTYIAPEAYGLCRCGTDIDIYDANVSTLMKEFDKNIDLPEFVPNEGAWESDQEVIAYIMNALLTEADEDNTLHTRAAFVKNYQADLGYAMSIVFLLSDEAMNDIKTTFDNMGAWDKIGLLSGDGLYNFLKPFLNKYNVQYDDTKLKSACSSLIKLITGPGAALLAVLMAGNSPLGRTLSMHYPDTVWVLLNNYNSKI